VEDPFHDAFRGSFTSLMQWAQLDEFWATVQAKADAGWYIYCIGEPVPRSRVTPRRCRSSSKPWTSCCTMTTTKATAASSTPTARPTDLHQDFRPEQSRRLLWFQQESAASPLDHESAPPTHLESKRPAARRPAPLVAESLGLNAPDTAPQSPARRMADKTTPPFKPAWWLRNPHLQTLWPVFFAAACGPPLRRERLELPDGDFVDLDWT